MLAAFGLVACEKAHSPSGPQAAPATRGTTASSASAERGIAVPPDAALPDLPDGCYSGIERGEDPATVLTELAKRCASSMKPLLGEAAKLTLAQGQSRDVSFTVSDGSGCLRVVAVGGRGVGDLDLSIAEADGAVLGKDDLPAPFALVTPGGPVCVDRPGSYRAVLGMKRGAGDVLVQVYQAK